ncbi:cysteine-rich motor neuron 1 protein-like [Haliotis rubra]|uniref:cysteine-rich motor neuron 1 protein-like n=1 Tax=Haliotis rubra TaxID=36100 RepID=UPI001EE51284|nr:cysteine-rich motor neuron 1 protein-like [Haliotis rubra]
MASNVVYVLAMAACLSAKSVNQDGCSPFKCSQWCIFGYVEVNGCPTCSCCSLPTCPPPPIDVCPRGFKYVNGCPTCLCY